MKSKTRTSKLAPMDVEEDARQVPLRRSAAGGDRRQTFESAIRCHSKVMTQVTLDRWSNIVNELLRRDAERVKF
jgi:hypothetical protein